NPRSIRNDARRRNESPIDARRSTGSVRRLRERGQDSWRSAHEECNENVVYASPIRECVAGIRLRTARCSRDQRTGGRRRFAAVPRSRVRAEYPLYSRRLGLDEPLVPPGRDLRPVLDEAREVRELQYALLQSEGQIQPSVGP